MPLVKQCPTKMFQIPLPVSHHWRNGLESGIKTAVAVTIPINRTATKEPLSFVAVIFK